MYDVKDKRAFWYHQLGSPKYVLAPMVDQSEVAFRVLCKRHGTHLTYTPMISSRQLASSTTYRDLILQDLPEGDSSSHSKPVVAQLAGNDPAILLQAAKHIEHRCNAVDLNFGCPQKIARRGHYGAWLLDEPELIEKLVGTLHCRARLAAARSQLARESHAYLKPLQTSNVLWLSRSGCSHLTQRASI